MLVNMLVLRCRCKFQCIQFSAW